MGFRIASSLLSVLLGSVVPCIAASVPDAHASSGLEEEILVRRVHLPVLVEPVRKASSALCSALLPSQIDARLDGVPLRVTAFGPRTQPRTHALLIDTSGSMGDELEQARLAALEYVESLDPRDAVMLASFDDGIRLHAPVGAGREMVRERIRQLRGGDVTAMWDALHDLLRYLSSIPGEKVVVLISDGEDSDSRSGQRDRVVEMAGSLPDLTVFSIGLGLPLAVRSGAPLARAHLGGLARLTGGGLYEIDRATKLGRVFRKIRERLERRSYVSYVPGALGGRLRVRAVDGLPCRIVALGTPRSGAAVSRPSSRTARGEAEVLQALPAPALGEVIREVNCAEDLLLYLLDERQLTGAASAGLPPLMVRGRFLEIREQLGRALFEQYPDYREWARDRVRSSVERQIVMFREHEPRVSALHDDGLVGLRAALVEQACDPRRGSAGMFLAEWLGDVEAAEAALELERRVMNRILEKTVEPGEVRGLLDGWGRLRRLFPPAAGATTLTPLVPVYEPSLDVIGFYRFLPPRVDASESEHGATLPERPLGLLATPSLLETPEIERRIRRGLRVESLRYGPVGRRERKKLVCVSSSADGAPDLRPTEKVVIAMADPREGHGSLTIAAYFDEEPRATPVCWRVETSTIEESASSRVTALAHR